MNQQQYQHFAAYRWMWVEMFCWDLGEMNGQWLPHDGLMFLTAPLCHRLCGSGGHRIGARPCSSVECFGAGHSEQLVASALNSLGKKKRTFISAADSLGFRNMPHWGPHDNVGNMAVNLLPTNSCEWHPNIVMQSVQIRSKLVDYGSG